MYTSFFGLNEKPFAITPDPRYLYMSERHAEALAHLMYGIGEAGGFVQLTGEVGTGKTTVVRSLLGQIPQDADIALIFNPRLTPAEFLLSICEELHIEVPETLRNSTKSLVDILSRHLLDAHARGRRVVLIIDEAQNLSFDLLEQVRLLTNLETATQKLLQIILIGQPELREVLKRVELRQLAQRITGRYHLRPLSRAETAAYVRHRLRVAGAKAELFTGAALREVHRLTRGIPRVINVICDRSLLGAYTLDRHLVDAATVRRAAQEIYGRPVLPLWTRWVTAGALVAGMFLFTFGFWRLGGESPSGMTTAESGSGTASASPSAPIRDVATTAQPQKAETAPDPVSLANLLGTAADEAMRAENREAAFAELFELWSAHYEPGGEEPCLQAAAQGLECAFERGSWAQVRALNRPAILTLTDDSGAEHHVLITHLADEHATVRHAGNEAELSISELSKYWFGDFLLLWRPRIAGAQPLSMGMQGEAILWLRQSLEQLGNTSLHSDQPEIFDWELLAAVEDFQRSHRLTVDGIAGRRTQLAIDSALAAPGTPVL